MQNIKRGGITFFIIASDPENKVMKERDSNGSFARINHYIKPTGTK